MGLNTNSVYCSALHIYLVKAVTLVSSSKLEMLYFSSTLAVSFVFKGPDLQILDSQGVRLLHFQCLNCRTYILTCLFFSVLIEYYTHKS